jgi:integrase
MPIYNSPRGNAVLKNKHEHPTLIVMHFKFKGKAIVMSTGLKINPRQWLQKAQRPRTTHPDYDHINVTLKGYKDAMQEVYAKHGMEDSKAFKRRVKAKLGLVQDISPGQIPDFFIGMEEHFQLLKNRAPATLRKLHRVVELWKEFTEAKGMGSLSFKDFNRNLIEQYYNWMVYEREDSKKGGKLSPNTAANMVKQTHSLLNATGPKLYKGKSGGRGFHENTEYRDNPFRVTEKETPQVALTLEELKLVQGYSGEERLERIRDLFLIGCFTGQRISDYKRINRTWVKKMRGKEFLQFIAKKTERQITIPLLPQLKEILERYDYTAPTGVNGKVISEVKFNKYLKELCQKVGVNDSVEDQFFDRDKGEMIKIFVEKWSKVTSHTARRTAATVFYDLGLPLSDIMLITGHTTERNLKKYIRRDNTNAAIAMADRMVNLINEKWN